jgi:hypothetical protein
MKDIPRSLWAFAVISIASGAVFTVLHPHPLLGFKIFALTIEVGIAVLLLRGSRVVWTFALVSQCLGLLTEALGTPTWRSALGAAGAALLLLPASWRFVWRRQPVPESVLAEPRPRSWDPDDHPSEERPSGWYLDPENPRRMRFWNSEIGEWRGSTKAPRKQRWPTPRSGDIRSPNN